MHTDTITSFFTNYIRAFKAYDLSKVTACYHLPCTLHTPDNIVLLTDKKQCCHEFNNIFMQLQEVKTSDILVRKASYSTISNDLFLICLDLAFTDEQDRVFTDFCAIYHLARIDNEWGIVNVVSHELSNSIKLKHAFVLNC